MKRVGCLYESVFSRDNLYEAYCDARRGKRKKRACFLFEKNLGAHLEKLYFEIQSGRYKPQPYAAFIVYEPKKRVIHAPAFRDTVVQHALYRILYPLFDKTFIDTSFACRKGFGTHKAREYARKALQRCPDDLYTLKLDVRKFFYSIDRTILKRLIDQKIKDAKVVQFMMCFADMPEDRGIPIGNLLSQLYALIYLNPLDHYVKRVLKVADYVRYVDDFILFGLTRAECLYFKEQIQNFLREALHLELSKSSIQKIKNGVNFVGYRIWKKKCLIRKYSLHKFRRKLKEGDQAAIMSLLGHAKRTTSYSFLRKLVTQ